MNNEDKIEADSKMILKVLDELRHVLTATHEYHGDLRCIRELMNELDDCNYGSNLS